MQIAIVAKLRNGRLVRYREQFGLSQTEAGRLAEVGLWSWNAVECMRFKGLRYVTVKRVADLIGCEVEDIFPEELRHMNLSITQRMYREAEAQHVLAATEHSKFILPDPSMNGPLDLKELREQFMAVFTVLDERERRVLELRYGLMDGRSWRLLEIGQRLNLTRERVRMIECEAIRKLKESKDARPRLLPFVGAEGRE